MRSEFDAEDVGPMAGGNAGAECEWLSKSIGIVGPDVEVGIVRARSQIPATPRPTATVSSGSQEPGMHSPQRIHTS